MSPNPLHMLTPAQLRGVRAMVGWSREDLAKKSGVSAPTLRDFEVNNSDPKQGTVQKWRRALEAARIVFIDEDAHGGPRVRMRSTKGKR
jgi:predicted transcriptional regulator